jgi:hypothetical protein
MGGGEGRRNFFPVFQERGNMFRDRKYLFEYTSIGGGEGRKQFFPAVPRKGKYV